MGKKAKKTTLESLGGTVENLSSTVGSLSSTVGNLSVKVDKLASAMDFGFKRLDGKMDSEFKRLDSKMDSGFKRLDTKMDVGFKTAKENHESLARMISGGFEDVMNKLNDKAEKTDIARIEQGQESIQLRLGHLAPQFEVKELTRRVKRLEDKAGIRYAAGR